MSDFNSNVVEMDTKPDSYRVTADELRALLLSGSSVWMQRKKTSQSNKKK